MRNHFEASKGMEQGVEYSNAKATNGKAAIRSLFERVHRPGSTKVTHCYSAVKVAATWGVGFVGEYAGYVFTLEVQRQPIF